METFLQRKRIDRNIKREITKQKNLEGWTRSESMLEKKPEHGPSPLFVHNDVGTGDELVARGDNPQDVVFHTPKPDEDDEAHPRANLADSLVGRLDYISPKDCENSGHPQTLLVEGSSTDDCTPRDWSMARRVKNTTIIFGMVFVTGWTAAADSDSNSRAAAQFHISEEAETLSTALYLFGNAFGSLLSGLVSETLGRSASYLVFTFLYMIMVLITALAPNFAVQVVLRFFAGLFASPAMTIYGGSLADMYNNAQRSLVWPLFALSPILGPVLAPVAGGWLVQSSSISWRWVDWVSLIISAFVFLAAFFFLDETFSPMLLKWKAASLCDEVGDARFKSELEVKDSFLQRLSTNLTRPVIFFTREPIIIALGFYLTLIYVLVFTFLNGFTFIFEDTYSFSPGLRGTAFLAIAFGVLLNTALTPFFRSNYLSHLAIAAREQDIDEHSDEEPTLAPEIRLLPALICAPLLPISLFWLGWTNYRSISVASNIVAAGLFGFSLMGIFVSSYQYVIDSYETNSASALSSITFLRYFVAGGMVIASMPMYKGIGVHWTLTLMGCLGAVLVPVPFLLWKYGDKVRARSGFARKF